MPVQLTDLLQEVFERQGLYGLDIRRRTAQFGHKWVVTGKWGEGPVTSPDVRTAMYDNVNLAAALAELLGADLVNRGPTPNPTKNPTPAAKPERAGGNATPTEAKIVPPWLRKGNAGK